MHWGFPVEGRHLRSHQGSVIGSSSRAWCGVVAGTYRDGTKGENGCRSCHGTSGMITPARGIYAPCRHVRRNGPNWDNMWCDGSMLVGGFLRIGKLEDWRLGDLLGLGVGYSCT